jgi:hypothetical protein
MDIKIKAFLYRKQSFGFSGGLKKFVVFDSP